MGAISSQFLAKLSVHSPYCLSPQGEFMGCSEMSLEVQKWPLGTNAGSVQLPDSAYHGAALTLMAYFR